MAKFKMKLGSNSIKISGSDEFVQRGRELFIGHIKSQYGVDLNAKKNPYMGIDYVKNLKQCHHESSWRELADQIKNGTAQVAVGDTVSCVLMDGSPMEFVITDVTDRYVRFETQNFIGEKVKWNRENSNEGGYPKSSIRDYVDSTIWELLPEDLQAVVSDVDRKWKDQDGNCGTYTTKLFLPAASEIFDDCLSYGDRELYKQLDYYKDARNSVRVNKNGDPRIYWLASVLHCDPESICVAHIVDSHYAWPASALTYVSICFHISRV